MAEAKADPTLNIFSNRIRREFASLEEKLPPGVLLINKNDVEGKNMCLATFECDLSVRENPMLSNDFGNPRAEVVMELSHKDRYPFDAPSMTITHGQELLPSSMLQGGALRQLPILREWMPSAGIDQVQLCLSYCCAPTNDGASLGAAGVHGHGTAG
jgi:hypothetical protein